MARPLKKKKSIRVTLTYALIPLIPQEAPTFSFKDGASFDVRSGCLLEINLLEEIAVPSVNPFELEYLARIKNAGLATVLDSRYLATVDAVDKKKLPDGASINSTTGVLSWRPTQEQGLYYYRIVYDQTAKLCTCYEQHASVHAALLVLS